MKKRVLFLQTGGTIGMKNTTRGFLKPLQSGHDFLALVPQLSQLAKVSFEQIDNIDSSNVTPRHWEKWLKVLKKNYNLFDGFVITHGTDTMVYTASAFSFALTNLSKPLVFTGSQRPLGVIRSDAPQNLINSLESACRGPNKVSICFGNELLLGVKATKLSATNYVAFESFNHPHLAKMGVDYESFWQTEQKNSSKTQWQTQFDENVFCFKIFPGINAKILIETVKNKECHGLVLEAYGTGNVPCVDDSILNVIKEAKKLSKPLIIASQCADGRVDLQKYECGQKALKLGALSASDMTTEAAVVKLMHGLGMNLKGESFKKYFLKNICGERSL